VVLAFPEELDYKPNRTTAVKQLYIPTPLACKSNRTTAVKQLYVPTPLACKSNRTTAVKQLYVPILQPVNPTEPLQLYVPTPLACESNRTTAVKQLYVPVPLAFSIFIINRSEFKKLKKCRTYDEKGSSRILNILALFLFVNS
jgi:hypothetical protein